MNRRLILFVMLSLSPDEGIGQIVVPTFVSASDGNVLRRHTEAELDILRDLSTISSIALRCTSGSDSAILRRAS
jgi:hypothetical protein